jgi:hypothetical protein
VRFSRVFFLPCCGVLLVLLFAGRCCRSLDGGADDILNRVVVDKVIALWALARNGF